MVVFCTLGPAAEADALTTDVITVNTRYGTVITKWDIVNEDGTISTLVHRLFHDGQTDVTLYEQGEIFYFPGVTIHLEEPDAARSTEIGLPTKTDRYSSDSINWTVALLIAAITAGVGGVVQGIKSFCGSVIANLTSLSATIYFVSTIEQTLVTDGATTYYRASVLTYCYLYGYYQHHLGHGVGTYKGSYPL